MSKPINEAQKALKILYKQICNQSGPPGFDEFYPIDLEKLASCLGWRIQHFSMVGLYGISLIDAQTDFLNKIIKLSHDEDVTPGRINFSLAHELGHVVLHGEEGLTTLLRTRSLRDKEIKGRYRHPFEVEADRFAAELLMPSKAVIHQFKKLFLSPVIIASSSAASRICYRKRRGYNPEPPKKSEVAKAISIYSSEHCQVSLVNFFNVTPEAMILRLIELRLVLD